MADSRIKDMMGSAMILIQIDDAWPESQGFHDLLNAIALWKPVCLVIPDGCEHSSPQEYVSYTGNKLLIRGEVDSPENTEWLIKFFAKAGITKGSTVEILDRPV